MVVKFEIPNNTIGIGMTLLIREGYDLRWKVASISTDAIESGNINLTQAIKKQEEKDNDK